MSLTPEQREALDGLRRLEKRTGFAPAEVYRVLAAFPPEEGPRPWIAAGDLIRGERIWSVERLVKPSWERDSWWPTEAAARARVDELNRREP